MQPSVKRTARTSGTSVSHDIGNTGVRVEAATSHAAAPSRAAGSCMEWTCKAAPYIPIDASSPPAHPTRCSIPGLTYEAVTAPATISIIAPHRIMTKATRVAATDRG